MEATQMLFVPCSHLFPTRSDCLRLVVFLLNAAMELEENRAPPHVEDLHENRVTLISLRLSEGRERLQRMELQSMRDCETNQRDLQSQMTLFTWMEEQQVASALERRSMESELSKLRSEVERLQAVSTSPQVSDNDHASEEIDLKVSVQQGWNSVRRKALAPITPEAVRARTPSVKLRVVKENMFRSSPKPFPLDLNPSSTPGILPRPVNKVVTGSSASTLGSGVTEAKIKTHFSFKDSNERGRGQDEDTSDPCARIFEIPKAKNIAGGGLNARLHGKAHQVVDNCGACIAMAGKKTKTLDRVEKPPFKFVDIVRKKVERENLHGATCKLCTKFYDAVIADNGEGFTESQCLHLENSRHRYRDLPPATPEGFWNIGFDTEL